MTNQPVRVLHLITRLPVGGAERVILNTAALLDPQRFESIVCCIMDEGALAQDVRDLGVKVIVLNLGQKKGWDSKVVPALRQLIRDERIDLVHTHLYHANLYGRVAAHKCGVPSVITVHNTYSKTKWHRRFLNWWLGRRTAAVVAVSEDIKKDVVRWDHIRPERIEVIPNGISVQRMQSRLTPTEARTRLDLDPGAQVLVCVGRLEAQKGHRFLLQALPLLRTEGYEPVCLFAGDGRERDDLVAEAKSLGVSAQVRFLGMRSDIADIMRAADLYVMPSLWEGMSLALLDAMAARTPIVATDVGGMRQVLGDDLGVLVEPRRPDLLASAIANALASPEKMRQMGEMAYEHVCKNFSDRRMVDDIAEVYERTLGGPR